jgi:hypothetical protein
MEEIPKKDERCLRQLSAIAIGSNPSDEHLTSSKPMTDAQIKPYDSVLELFLQAQLFPKRIRFRRQNRNRRKVTESLLLVLKERYDEATRANVPTYIGVYNVGLFVVLLEQDISAYSESIFFARSEWHRQFYARGLAVLLYEGAEDLPQLLGKKYREWIADLELNSQWVTALNNIGAKLSRFRRSHSDFLSDVRNLVGAHKDHNTSAQLDVFANLKAVDVYRLGAEFSEPLRNLIEFYIRLLTYMHNPAIMMRQVAKAMP